MNQVPNASFALKVIFARSRDLPLFVLGSGSNLLVADADWPGLVLKISISGIDRTGLTSPNHNCVEANRHRADLAGCRVIRGQEDFFVNYRHNFRFADHTASN